MHIGQFRKKQRKAGDAANLPPLHSGGGGGAGSSKTLGRNYFSRIKVGVKFARVIRQTLILHKNVAKIGQT